MAEITRKEWTNVVAYITACATVEKNSMERAAVMYVITEQYRKRNRNDKHYETTVMTYIKALNRECKAVQV